MRSERHSALQGMRTKGYSSDALDHRVTGWPPFNFRVIKHQLDNHWQQFSKQLRAITQLLAIDLAVPGRAAMNQLVAQCVQTIEHHTEQGWGFPPASASWATFLPLAKRVCHSSSLSLPA